MRDSNRRDFLGWGVGSAMLLVPGVAEARRRRRRRKRTTRSVPVEDKPVDYKAASQQFAQLLRQYLRAQEEVQATSEPLKDLKARAHTLEHNLRAGIYPAVTGTGVPGEVRRLTSEQLAGIQGRVPMVVGEDRTRIKLSSPGGLPDYGRLRAPIGVGKVRMPKRFTEPGDLRPKRRRLTWKNPAQQYTLDDKGVLKGVPVSFHDHDVATGKELLYTVEVSYDDKGAIDHYRLRQELFASDAKGRFFYREGETNPGEMVEITDCDLDGIVIDIVPKRVRYTRGMCFDEWKRTSTSSAFASDGVTFSVREMDHIIVNDLDGAVARLRPQQELINRGLLALIQTVTPYVERELFRLGEQKQQYRAMAKQLKEEIGELEQELQLSARIREAERFGVDASDLRAFEGLAFGKIDETKFDELRGKVDGDRLYRKLAGIRKLTPVVDGPRYQSALTVNNESTAGDGGLALHYAAMFVGKQGHRVDLLHMWEHDLDVVVALHREPNNNWRYVVNGYVSPLKFKKRWQAVDAAALHEGLPARGDQKRLYHHRNNIQPGPWLYNDGAAAAMHPVAK